MMLSIGTFSTFPQLNIMHHFIIERNSRTLTDDNKAEAISQVVSENSNILPSPRQQQQQQQRTAYGTIIQSSYSVSFSSPQQQQIHLVETCKALDDCQNDYYYIKNEDDYCLAVSTGLPTYTIVENTTDPFFNFFKLP